MTEGFSVDLDVLAEASRGVQDALKELSTMAWGGQYGASSAQALGEVSGLDLGHEGLESAMDEFASTWQPGLRTLLQDSETAAGKLDEVRQGYEAMEADVTRQLSSIFGGHDGQ